MSKRHLTVVLYGVRVQPTTPLCSDPGIFITIFRHSCIDVNVNSGIPEARDPIGKRVGNPECQTTDPVWIHSRPSDRAFASETLESFKM
jgi:4,5-dihydroxyphthalate decarboxylase